MLNNPDGWWSLRSPARCHLRAWNTFHFTAGQRERLRSFSTSDYFSNRDGEFHLTPPSCLNKDVTLGGGAHVVRSKVEVFSIAAGDSVLEIEK